MPPFERIVTIEHPLRPGGRLRLRGIDGPVALRPSADATATVRVRYQVRAADEAAADRAIGDAQARVDRATDQLEVDGRDRRWGLLEAVSWLFGEGRVRVAFDAEVPPGVDVRVDTVSGEIEADGLRDTASYHSVSGSVTLRGTGGTVQADTVSGRVEVLAGAELRLDARSVSGSLRAAAPRFAALRLATTSGSVSLEGPLDAAGRHEVETVSGGLHLDAPGGATIDMQTISGGVRADREARVERLGGGRRVVLGDGAARLHFRSMSGGLDVSTSSWRGSAAGSGARSGNAAGGAPTAPVPQPADAPVPEPSAAAVATEPGPAEPDQLGILRALERGEIDVDEAAARLARVGEERSRA
ncbi:MAG TPA: DUF4097 family beta strand repeat-containing protein [Candidatus Limnocylindrales bacterium]